MDKKPLTIALTAQEFAALKAYCHEANCSLASAIPTLIAALHRSRSAPPSPPTALTVTQLQQQIQKLHQQVEDLKQEKADLEILLDNTTTHSDRISAQLQTAKQTAEVASQAKSAFLARMSHELRTPLNAILGFSQILSQDPTLGPAQKSQLAIINRSGEHLLALINDVLDMSKIEAGKLILKPETINLQRLIYDLQAMLEFKARAKGLQLIVSLSPELPQFIQVDAGKLRQILINLLGNAIKFTHTGTITLEVTKPHPSLDYDLPCQENQGILPEPLDDCDPVACSLNTQSLVNPLHFAVTDTGPGIAPQDLERVFEAFVQTEQGQAFQTGTGLGLSISAQLVQLMGGKLQVESTLSQGTCFHFEIVVPAVPSGLCPVATNQPIIVGLAPDQPTYRILVVDDVEDSRLLLTQMLQQVGFEVAEAENGEVAIARWQTWHPQAIFMDWHMPVMDGAEATRQIRAGQAKSAPSQGQSSNPKTVTEPGECSHNPKRQPNPGNAATISHPIIIAVSASVFDEHEAEILKTGCNALIRKPVTANPLFETLADLLGVRYRYAHETSLPLAQPAPNHTQIPNVEPLTAKILVRSVDPSWLRGLYTAASVLDSDSCLKLIQQLPKDQANLAISLAELVHSFRFDLLMELTQPM